jgi:hypothetical protein
VIHECPNCRCGSREVLRAHVLELARAGRSVPEIAGELSLTAGLVRGLHEEAGAPKHRRGPKTVEGRVGPERLARALSEAAGNAGTLARLLGCSRPAAYSVLERAGFPDRKRVPQRAPKTSPKTRRAKR